MVQRGMTTPGLDPRLGGLEGATFLHAESQYLAKLFTERLADEGYNMVLDNTMHSPTAMAGTMNDMADEGYKYRGLFMDIPVDESRKSIRERYLRHALDGTGRFVPTSIIGDRTSTRSLSRNRDAFDTMVGQDWFTEWMAVDNTGVSDGNPRKVIEAQGTGKGEHKPKYEPISPSFWPNADKKSQDPEFQQKTKKRRSFWERLFGKSPEQPPLLFDQPQPQEQPEAAATMGYDTTGESFFPP